MVNLFQIIVVFRSTYWKNVIESNFCPRTLNMISFIQLFIHLYGSAVLWDPRYEIRDCIYSYPEPISQQCSFFFKYVPRWGIRVELICHVSNAWIAILIHSYQVKRLFSKIWKVLHYFFIHCKKFIIFTE